MVHVDSFALFTYLALMEYIVQDIMLGKVPLPNKKLTV